MAPPAKTRDSAKRFNTRCRWSALGWLLLIVLSLQAVRPNDQDFGQFYMGGLMARLGQWQALYPRPVAGSPVNAGYAEGSVPQAEYNRLASQYGADTDKRYIQLPATAILFIPLSCLPYRAAHWMWLVALCAAGRRVAVQAGLTLEALTPGPTKSAGVLTLIVAGSPLMLRSIRVANVSPVVAFCIGVAVLDLMRSRWARGATAIVIGSMLKYAPAVLVVAAVKRNRKLLLATIAGFLLVALFCRAIDGGEPMRQFVHRIAPTLTHPARWQGNQSLQGMLLRLGDGVRLTPAEALIVAIARWTVLAIIVALMLSRQGVSVTRAAYPLAGSAALLAWLLIFSPLAWEHYYVYFFPLWGWLLWEARQSVPRRWIAGAVMIAHWYPWALMRRPFQPREPLLSIMFFGAVLMLALAISRLSSRQPEYGLAASAG